MSQIAKMGYVGYVVFKGSGNTGTILGNSGTAVRATSASLMLKQAIEFPDLVDNKADQTVFQIQPKMVDGDISFPLVGDQGVSANGCTTETTSLGEKMWSLAAARDAQGRMTHDFETTIRYSDNLAYTYGGCLINRMEMAVSEQNPINCALNVIGGAKQKNGTNTLRTAETNISNIAFLAPARILTWADVRLGVWKDASNKLVLPEEIREFSASIDNQVDRFYTFNKKLEPQDIAGKKRKISGRLRLMGHSTFLSDWTETNQDRCTASSGVSFGYTLCGGGNNISWATGFSGVVFTIEEVNLSTGLFETSTTWTALGICSNNYQATWFGGQYDPENTFPTGDNYGTRTIDDNFLSEGSQF